MGVFVRVKPGTIRFRSGFAFLPTKINDGSTVFLKKYRVKEIYTLSIDTNGHLDYNWQLYDHSIHNVPKGYNRAYGR